MMEDMWCRLWLFNLQVVLSSNASSVSELPGFDPHGLCHLPPAEGTDCLHLRKSLQEHTADCLWSQVWSSYVSHLFFFFRSWDQCAFSLLLQMASISTTPCWSWSSASPPTSGKSSDRWQLCWTDLQLCFQQAALWRLRLAGRWIVNDNNG